MFTGIVEATGKIVRRGPDQLSVHLSRSLKDLSVGESIAIDGVCLTVERVAPKKMTFRILPETFRVTTLGQLKAGDWVNLERAIQAGTRLGGHLLLGHVDGRGAIRSRVKKGDSVTLELSVPAQMVTCLSPKGPIAVDGVSLTLDPHIAKNRVWIHLISHTLKETALGRKPDGSQVNIELDLIAKYLRGML